MCKLQVWIAGKLHLCSTQTSYTITRNTTATHTYQVIRINWQVLMTVEADGRE